MNIKRRKTASRTKTGRRRPKLSRSSKKTSRTRKIKKKVLVETIQNMLLESFRLSQPTLYEQESISRKILLEKSSSNPIMKPRPENSWEAYQVFNPGVLLLDDKVHIIYRAIGIDGISRFGYAVSSDGFKIDERLPYPIYQRKMNKLSYYPSISGGGFGGCEDPRIAKIEDRLYMTYNAFGPGELRVAFTSIDREDFLNRKWTWKEETIISNPNEAHKNFVLFPEKINSRYAILHSISPKIKIKYFDNLEFRDGEYVESRYIANSNPNGWESKVKSPGAPPLKTDEGWLLFYHGICKREPWKYKIGVMLLDLENPEEILYTSRLPIIEADQTYENSGFKPGVTYTCGAVIKDKKLLVYYGTADTYISVAYSPLDEFLDNLRRDRSLLKEIGEDKVWENGFNSS